MELLLTAIMLGAVVAVVAAPLVRRSDGGGRDAPRRRAIEAARDAKYRELLDAELDYRTGKLSEHDYRDVDDQLRVEASELLGRLDAEERAERRT
jgi:hypothetical protein